MQWAKVLSIEHHNTNIEYQQCIMICLNSLLNCGHSARSVFNNDFLRILARYLDNEHLWQDALDLLKIVVSKSSTLDQQQSSNSSHESESQSPTSTVEQIQQQLFGTKKQLPGRTLDFNFDFSMLGQQQPHATYKHRFNTNAAGMKLNPNLT